MEANKLSTETAVQPASWEIYINGTEGDLDTLALSSRSGFRIEKNEGGEFVGAQYFIRCHDLRDPDSDSEDVVSLARSLVDQFSGACQVIGLDAIEYVGLVIVQADGRRNTVVSPDPATVRVRGGLGSVSITRPDGSVEVRHPCDPAVAWIRTAQTDVEVRKILELRSRNDLQPDNLNFIMEKIEAAIGEPVHRRGWTSRRQRERFERSINSEVVYGDRARHAREKWNHHDNNPMFLPDARRFVDRILSKFLDSRSQTNP